MRGEVSDRESAQSDLRKTYSSVLVIARGVWCTLLRSVSTTAILRLLPIIWLRLLLLPSEVATVVLVQASPSREGQEAEAQEEGDRCRLDKNLHSEAHNEVDAPMPTPIPMRAPLESVEQRSNPLLHGCIVSVHYKFI